MASLGGSEAPIVVAVAAAEKGERMREREREGEWNVIGSWEKGEGFCLAFVKGNPTLLWTRSKGKQCECARVSVRGFLSWNREITRSFDTFCLNKDYVWLRKKSWGKENEKKGSERNKNKVEINEMIFWLLGRKRKEVK